MVEVMTKKLLVAGSIEGTRHSDSVAFRLSKKQKADSGIPDGAKGWITVEKADGKAKLIIIVEWPVEEKQD